MGNKLRKLKKERIQEMLSNCGMIIYPGFPRIVLAYTCYTDILLNSAPLTHKNILFWIRNFVSPYSKVKLGKKCLRKINQME
jgi:hypothetical protein